MAEREDAEADEGDGENLLALEADRQQRAATARKCRPGQHPNHEHGKAGSDAKHGHEE